ncbi:hypothetical protein EVAR_10528_1 [Eumeta japonica]|uniref:Uncharacterized protein n=1 Tax=Eumeta variegata TaxID=151549 RepID=A0A4C1TKY3_EUMVA|nr:hypothetical protein EVAR_10528_1 [Eumeta japonica]
MALREVSGLACKVYLVSSRNALSGVLDLDSIHKFGSGSSIYERYCTTHETAAVKLVTKAALWHKIKRTLRGRKWGRGMLNLHIASFAGNPERKSFVCLTVEKFQYPSPDFGLITNVTDVQTIQERQKRWEGEVCIRELLPYFPEVSVQLGLGRDYEISQLLTGHGCFHKRLNGLGLPFCDVIEDPVHALSVPRSNLRSASRAKMLTSRGSLCWGRALPPCVWWQSEAECVNTAEIDFREVLRNGSHFIAELLCTRIAFSFWIERPLDSSRPRRPGAGRAALDGSTRRRHHCGDDVRDMQPAETHWSVHPRSGIEPGTRCLQDDALDHWIPRPFLFLLFNRALVTTGVGASTCPTFCPARVISALDGRVCLIGVWSDLVELVPNSINIGVLIGHASPRGGVPSLSPSPAPRPPPARTGTGAPPRPPPPTPPIIHGPGGQHVTPARHRRWCVGSFKPRRRGPTVTTLAARLRTA